MRKLFKIINVEFKKHKKLLIFVTILLTIGLITGSLFITILNDSDKKLVLETITNYFNQIKLNKVDFLYCLRTSLISNLIYILFIWLLGISIIGIPLILFLIFIKSFILGFSIGSIICKYGFSGILLSLSYTFPHHIINIIIVSFIGLYALKVSLSLFQLIFSKKQINFKIIIRKYFGVLIITIILAIMSSLIETFITPYFINLFSFLIK
ncbi:MAG: stage II sporulation protein M [Bacilli bacterium]|nr:stage II sporulation protein M [Bacilli bacterium]